MEINNVLAQMRTMSLQASSNVHNVQETSATSGAAFSTMLKDSIESVNQIQQQAGALSTAFSQGETDASLAEVMVSLQKANLSFQTTVQVRNKLVEAYKDVMRMTM